MADITRERMTMQEFLELPETNRIVELIHGELIVNPPPKDPHQLIVGSIYSYLKARSSRDQVRISPIGVRLDAKNFVEPDIIWVSGPQSKSQLGEDGYWHGAPDLVVEILSPGTARRDRREKFRLYEKHGAREYWIVDPEAEYIEAWRLDGDKFIQIGIFGPGESFESPVLGGQSVDVDTLFSG